MGSILSLKLGTALGPSSRRYLGVMLSGFPWLSHDMLLSCGLFSGVLLLQRIGSAGGDLRVILFAGSVMGDKNL